MLLLSAIITGGLDRLPELQGRGVQVLIGLSGPGNKVPVVGGYHIQDREGCRMAAGAHLLCVGPAVHLAGQASCLT